YIWSALFAIFAVLCAFVALRLPAGATHAPKTGGRVGVNNALLWLMFAIAPSALFLGVTSHLTQNVATIPLLWVLPLALYLLSFVVAFEGGHIYNLRRWWPAVLLWVVAMAWVKVDSRLTYNMFAQFAAFL